MTESHSQELPPFPAKNPPYVKESNTTDYLSAALTMHDLLTKAQALSSFEFHDPVEDFQWFTSGGLDASSFKGKYIAIWKKQVVASGSDAKEVENIAKAIYGENCRPAVVYISEDDEAIL